MTGSNRSAAVGVALGSGAARGWAHIGVLRALEDAGVAVSSVAGSSIGAVVGAAYACGRLDTLDEVARSMQLPQIISLIDLTLPRSGLMDGERIVQLMRQRLPIVNIENLSIPFCAVAADLLTGQQIHISTGPLIDAVRASLSIPGVFTPVQWFNHRLIDGGVVDPVPVRSVRDLGAQYVIAVDINYALYRGRSGHQTSPARLRPVIPLSVYRTIRKLPIATRIRRQQTHRQRASHPSLLDVLMTSVNILEARVTESQFAIDPPDLVIRPPLQEISFLDFHRADEMIAIGYKATQDALRSAP